QADALIAEADVFVMSSKEEGLGSVVLHARALGKPVVATAGGGLSEIVPARWLVPVGDADALARGGIEALDPPVPVPLPPQFTAFPREYELLVLDDASTDDTREVLASYAKVLPMTIVTHRERRGYARSLEELLRLALQRTDRPKRDCAITLHADFVHSPESME